MAQVIKSVLVGQSARRMFELVDAVEKYPEFLPWCGGSECTFRDERVTRATLHINYRGIRQSFSTENLKTPPSLMQIRLIEGPFKTLEGSWRFTNLSAEGCKVELSLSYEFSSRLLERLIGPVFGYIANSMVDAFVKRANSIHG
ncbi:MAG: cyclase/dehydrase [Betaproteobacteria bacterium]|jgi:ribosome-associated toxin RatA of RatAB toxin-antitoxin module|nr:cyclase/dehydrase [Betaproteobacteria bacterium]